MQATQEEGAPQDPRMLELQGLVKTLPLNSPLTEANLHGLNSLERAFLTHEHRLLRIDRYCQDQVPQLDMQFTELKTHLSTYDLAHNHSCSPTNNRKVYSECVKVKAKTQQAWDNLVLKLDMFDAERKSEKRTPSTILDTHQAIKDVRSVQRRLEKEIMKLPRLHEDGPEKVSLKP